MAGKRSFGVFVLVCLRRSEPVKKVKGFDLVLTDITGSTGKRALTVLVNLFKIWRQWAIIQTGRAFVS
jgi:hypothetical protein